MTIRVKVKTNQSQTKVEQVASSDQLTTFKVWLRSAPEKGRANAELIVSLSEFFGVKTGNVRIISGASSLVKLVKIGKSRTVLT